MAKISQNSDDLFTFRCYHFDDGLDAIRRWYDQQEAGVRGATDEVLDALRRTLRGRWRGRQFKTLGRRRQDACRGLAEVRVIHEGVHYRILGVEDPDARSVTLLYGFRKDDDPDYSKSCPEAQDRKERVEADATLARDCHV